MISPTGKGVRIDSEGSGEYGAPRGNRRHNGIDYLCDSGQDIVAPFDMFIVRVALPRTGSKLSGIQWRTQRSEGKMFYFLPDVQLINTWVGQNQVIGKAQSVSSVYGLPDMKDHIHFQVDR